MKSQPSKVYILYPSIDDNFWTRLKIYKKYEILFCQNFKESNDDKFLRKWNEDLIRTFTTYIAESRLKTCHSGYYIYK